MSPPLPWPVSALRDRFRTLAAAVGDIRVQVLKGRDEAQYHFDRLRAAIDDTRAIIPPPPDLQPVIEVTREESRRLIEALRVVGDDEPRARAALWQLRGSDEYEAAFAEDEPLVSVVIPTYQNYKLLRERALPSVLGQTYANLEVIVVGDAAPEQTRSVVEGFGDPRVRFHNLPVRGPYPEHPEKRWYVAGVPPYNTGVRMARGRWIAPQDDDDVWHDDHVEKLLALARSQRAELAYGRFRVHKASGAVATAGAFPPTQGEFTLQAAMYHAGLAQIFELELADSEWDVPYDWSLCRRMLRAGVRAAMLDEEVVHYYAARHHELDAVDYRRELVPEGWEAGRAREQETGAGWDVEAVADAYRRKWPAFVAATEGTGPLGVFHEVAEGDAIRRDDITAQNTVLAFGHVLARTAADAGGAKAISVLDWGGSLGHYWVLARGLLDDVSLDYHVRELPAVAARGREVAPEVTFHDDDACLERRYDLVVASGSLQYVDDWQGLLRRLAGVAERWLFVTRLPVVRRHPGYVERQRAYAYGYETEYVGRVFNQDELVDVVRDAGFELVREYLLHAPMPVAGAPEDPVHVGLAFRPAGAAR